jgi:tetraacyldisaccharide 4'-kinase
VSGAGRPSLLRRQWQQGGWLSTLLRPLSAVAAAMVARKRLAYRSGRKTAFRAAVPVIVVGNLYVGGTGKTPVVIALTHALQAAGRRPGIVSRGYGARVGATPRVGCGALSPALFGDEPALIAAATQAPVAVHPRRTLAVQALLAAHPDIDVIVSDDGLQHLALARDLEIVVQDERGLGNGRLLPAGPLREPASRLAEVDAIITNRSGGASEAARAPAFPATSARQVDMQLQPGEPTRLVDGARTTLAALAQASEQGSRTAACAGIGNPARFFATLARAGVRLSQRVALPDHYDYSRSPFTALLADTILITEKDAIKCAHLKDERLWAVPVWARFSDPGFLDWVIGRIGERPPAPEGSKLL